MALTLPAAAAFSQGGTPPEERNGLQNSFLEVKPQNKMALVIGCEKGRGFGSFRAPIGSKSGSKLRE